MGSLYVNVFGGGNANAGDMPQSNDSLPAQPEETSGPTSLAQLDAERAPKAAIKPPAMRGDDVIGKARELSKPTPEEARVAALYKQSEEIVLGEIQNNPALDEQIGAKIKALTDAGRLDDVHNLIIDAADQVKIRELEKEKPQWFTSKDAALSGFLNEATFGQLSKVFGGIEQAGNAIANSPVGQAMGMEAKGRPYEEVVAEKAEQFRLLSKAFPGWATVGQVSSYLVPGSPARAMFEGAANLGSRAVLNAAAKSVMTKAATNPGFLAKVAASAAGGATSAAAIRGASATLGANLEEFNLDRGAGEAASAAVGGGLAGAAIPVIGEAVSAAASAAAPYISKAAKGFSNSVAKQAQDLSGTNAQALRAYNRTPELIQKAAGKDFTRAEKLKNYLENIDTTLLPERQAADELLVNFKAIDAKPLIDALKSAHGGNDPQLQAQANLVRQWADNFANKFARTADQTVPVNPNSLTGIETKVIPGKVDTRVSANQLREWVDELQQSARKFYGKDAPFAAQEIKSAAALGRQLILNAAKTEGENGALYAQSMEKLAAKRDVVGFLMDRMGSSDATREVRAKSFYRNIFGVNNEAIEARMLDLDKRFGTTFWDEAKQSFFSRQLGEKGKPQLLPQQQTGKSLLGVVLGAAVKGPVGAVTGGLASSPRVGAAAIGASDTITGFVRQMVAKPEVLARLAGQASRSGNAAALAQMRVPEEIRKIAQGLSSTLTKDGPVSAASTTRLIADTPYFVGLVHYFDVADRAMQAKGTAQAMRNQYQQPRQGAPEIATPR